MIENSECPEDQEDPRDSRKGGPADREQGAGRGRQFQSRGRGPGRSDRPRGNRRDGQGPRQERDGRGRGARDESRGSSRTGGRRFDRDRRRDERGDEHRSQDSARGFRGRGEGRPERRGEGRFDRRRDERGGRRGGSFRGRDDQRGREREFRGSDRRDDRREEPRIVGPEIPEGFDPKALPFGVRAELRGLSKDRADQVAQHIWAAGLLVDEDPELAFEHAETARQLAPRLAIVREAAAETSYAAGKFDVALREYRAIRRMVGGDELVPVIADCLRAVGKPREALETLEEMDVRQTPAVAVIEGIIIEAGTRSDLGQRDEALRLLKTASGRNAGPTHARARLWYAYAEMLLEVDRPDEAREAFAEAAMLDHDGALDSSDRVAELDGFTLPDSLELDEETQDANTEQEKDD